jgi:hypothetical protein
MYHLDLTCQIIKHNELNKLIFLQITYLLKRYIMWLQHLCLQNGAIGNSICIKYGRQLTCNIQYAMYDYAKLDCLTY